MSRRGTAQLSTLEDGQLRLELSNMILANEPDGMMRTESGSIVGAWVEEP